MDELDEDEDEDVSGPRYFSWPMSTTSCKQEQTKQKQSVKSNRLSRLMKGKLEKTEISKKDMNLNKLPERNSPRSQQVFFVRLGSRK